MMKKRIFIAIKISPELEKSVELWQNKHSGFNVRWIKPRNLHITLITPWYVDENQLVEVVKLIKVALADKTPFTIKFNRVLFGPPGNTPRLIWAEADCSASAGNLAKRPCEAQKFPGISPIGRNQTDCLKEFIELKNDLEDSLFKSRNSGFYHVRSQTPMASVDVFGHRTSNGVYKKEQRQPKPHLTIARFKPYDFIKTKMPPINEVVAWRLNIDSVAIMESELKRGETEYIILEPIPLQ